MTSDKVLLRHCLLHEFDKGNNEAIACCSIHHVQGEDETEDSTYRRWHRKLRKKYRRCQDRANCEHSSLIAREALESNIASINTLKVYRTTVK